MRKLGLLVLWLLCGILLPLATDAKIDDGVYTVEGGNKTVIGYDMDYFGGIVTVASGDLDGYYFWGWNEPSYDNSGNLIPGKEWEAHPTNGVEHDDDWGGGNDDDSNGYNSGLNPKRQGPCPEGYHVPSRGEFNTLEFFWDNKNGGNTWGNTQVRNPFLEVFNLSIDYYAISSNVLDTDCLNLLGNPTWYFKYPMGTDCVAVTRGKSEYDDIYDRYKVRCFKDVPIIPQTYTVSFFSGTQLVTSGEIVDGGLRNEDIPSVTKEGYNFDYRYVQGAEDTEFDFSGTTITGNISLYAKWTIAEYEIRYNLNDGVETRGNPTTYTALSGTFGLHQPTKTGYMFLGWTGSNGDEINANIYIRYGSTGDRTYNAVWGSFEDIDEYFISDTGAVSYITLMDRNMGASTDDITSTGSYGFKYQRGNNYGFADGCWIGGCLDEIATYQVSSRPRWNGCYNAKGYDGVLFIKSNIYNNYDYWNESWHSNHRYNSGANENLWGGTGDYDNNDGLTSGNPIIGRTGPCPVGYHVPSIGELRNLSKYWEIGDLGYQFQQNFNIPFAGYRMVDNGAIYNQGSGAVLWSSSPYSHTGSASYGFTFGMVSAYPNYRANGNSVRCFSNNYMFSSPSMTIYPNGGTGSVVIVEGNIIKSLGTPKKANSLFEGWYDADSEGNKIETGSDAPANLYARWNCEQGYAKVDNECVESYTITYNLNDGIESRANPTTYTALSGTFGLYQPTKTGYMFLGWTGSNGDIPNANVYIAQGSTGDRTYNAVWGIFEDIDAYFISDTGAVSYITLMDRNMGATMTGAGADANTGSYGFKYQWGNNQGFADGCWEETCGDAVTTNSTGTKAIWDSDYDNSHYFGAMFIKGESSYGYDYWSDSISKNGNHFNLWGGGDDSESNNWGLDIMTAENITNRQGPCPAGYHVPSIGEWNNLLKYRVAVYTGEGNIINNWDTSNGLNSFESDGTAASEYYNMFNMPFAGSRNYSDVILNGQNLYGGFWSSSPYSQSFHEARYSEISIDDMYNNYSIPRSYADSIRCLSNDYLFEHPSIVIDPDGLAGAMILVEGNKIRVLGTPKKTNTIFEGWYDAGTGGNKIETGNDAPANLYARWRCVEGYTKVDNECVQAFTVTFDAETNGGTASTGSELITSGTQLDLSKYTATKQGWTFTGWNTNSGATEPMSDPIITGAITLYAIFSKTLTVTYDTGTGVSEISKNSDTCTLYNTDTSCIVTSPDVTLSEGYGTGTWNNGNNTVNPGEDITLTGDDNYTATATLIKYNITYNLDGGVLSGENTTGYTVESDDVTLINPTKIGYIFTGRSGTDIDDVSTSVTIAKGSTGDRIYEANWEAIIYKITFNLDGESIIITGNYGSPVTPPDNPTRNGYTFKGRDTEIPATMPANDMTINAKREKVSGGSSGGGGGGGNSSSNTDNASSQTGSQIDSNTGSIASGTNEKEPESTTGSNAEIQTGNQVDSSEQAPQNDTQDTKDSPVDKPVSEGQSYSTEFQQAYEFAKGKGITTMPTIQKAQMNSPLTRIAMAKMLSQYAMNVLGQKPTNITTPNFNDVTDKQNSDYDDGVTLAYQLGIMGQNMPNNNFRPDDEVTRAEFATALSRMLYRTSDGEYKSTSEYYVNHMRKLVKEGIITRDEPNMKEMRGYVMIMLMRSAK